jgi:hypothetical protein
MEAIINNKYLITVEGVFTERAGIYLGENNWLVAGIDFNTSWDVKVVEKIK